MSRHRHGAGRAYNRITAKQRRRRADTHVDTGPSETYLFEAWREQAASYGINRRPR